MTKTEADTGNRFIRFLFNIICAFAVWISNIRVHVSGLDRIPSDGRFLLVSNHISAYDPIVTYHMLKNTGIRFVSKPENFKIPVCGFLMKKMGFMSIDRENARNALKTVYEAADMIRDESIPVGIYPEGTRNKTPEKGLLKFHDGVFKIAKRAGVPVVVVTVSGTDKVAANLPFKRSDVYLTVSDILPAEFVINSSDRDIGLRVRNAVELTLMKGSDEIVEKVS